MRELEHLWARHGSKAYGRQQCCTAYCSRTLYSASQRGLHGKMCQGLVVMHSLLTSSER